MHALLACLLLAPAPLDWNEPAMTLRRMAVVLGERTGKKLEVAPALANEVIYLRCRQRPAEEVLGQIAAITFARWVPEGETIRLSPDPDLTRAQLAREAEGRVRQVKAWQERVVSVLRDTPTFDAAAATALFRQLSVPADPRASEEDRMRQLDRNQTLRRQRPDGRLIARILAAIDPKDLTHPGHEGRVVLATRHNRLQKPLAGPKVEAALAEYVRESEVWHAAAASNQRVLGYNPQRPRTEAPAKLIAAIEHDPWGSSTVTVTGFGTDGSQLVQRIDFVESEYDFAGQFKTFRPNPESVGMLNATSNEEDDAEVVVPEAVLRMLRDPVAHEPLAVLAPLYDGFEKDPMIVLVPEGLGSLGWGFDEPSGADILEGLGALGVTYRQQGEWAVFSIDQALRERSMRVDRDRLRVWTHRFMQDKPYRLTEMAALEAACKSLLVYILEPSIVSGSDADYGVAVSLGETEWSALRQGKPIALLPGSRLRAAVESGVFRNAFSLHEPGNDDDLGVDGFLEEPTLALPNGIVAGALIEADFEDEEVVIRSLGPRSGPFAPFAESAEETDLQMDAKGQPIEPWRMGTRTTIHFRVRLAEGVEARFDVEDVRERPGARPSADFLRRVQESAQDGGALGYPFRADTAA